jgi:hypothetical protein
LYHWHPSRACASRKALYGELIINLLLAILIGIISTRGFNEGIPSASGQFNSTSFDKKKYYGFTQSKHITQ